MTTPVTAQRSPFSICLKRKRDKTARDLINIDRDRGEHVRVF